MHSVPVKDTIELVGKHSEKIKVKPERSIQRIAKSELYGLMFYKSIELGKNTTGRYANCRVMLRYCFLHVVIIIMLDKQIVVLCLDMVFYMYS